MEAINAQAVDEAMDLSQFFWRGGGQRAQPCERPLDEPSERAQRVSKPLGGESERFDDFQASQLPMTLERAPELVPRITAVGEHMAQRKGSD